MRKAIVVTFIAVVALMLAVITMQSPSSAATTIFFDDFNDGYSGWSSSGNVTSDNLPSIEPDSVRLKKDGQIWRTISTAGYSDITVTWNMAAQALENGEYCYAEVNTGSGWSVIASLTNGQDDQTFYSGTENLSSAADDNANFQIRFRVVANALGDYCYVEDLTIAGTQGGTTPTATATATATPDPNATPTPTPEPGSTVPGDPLTGSGNVSRSTLTYSTLMNGPGASSPVNNDAMALPANAAPADHTFEGRLELQGEATNGSFNKITDDYNYDNDSQRLHLPDFDFAFVQNGSHLIPAQRGVIRTSHPYWEIILGPGRVWKENGDNGYSRASFPFALVEHNANCTHNGVMTFLFDDTSVSKVWYQITQETCLYFKGDFWGLLDATYHAESVTNGSQISSDYVQEVEDKFPSKPFSQLDDDYPGTDLSQFGSGITPEHMSTYGFVIDGTNYVAGCDTRYGAYPYCSSMRLPSYSTAKSMFASMAAMRLAQKYGMGVYDELIKDHVSEYASSSGDWSSVTVNNTLDMATGNYRFWQNMRDEGGPIMADFFEAESYADRIAEAFSFPNKDAPDTEWVYHTSDTFIVTRAMHNYLQSQEGSGADIFEMIVDDIFTPLDIGPGAHTSMRTYESSSWKGQPWGGYGLFVTQDDVAKVVTFLNNDGGAAGGTQLLHPDALADTMQQDATDRGLPTGTGFMYNNGFWAKEFTPQEFPEYSCTFWAPFMSGYGGITIVMMPNGSTYYYFSDNDEFSWYDAVSESNNIRSHCQ